MKKILLSLMLVTTFFSSCEFEMSSNGELDGFWQLTAIDTLATGSRCDMHASKIYWAVQMHLLEIQDKKNVNQYILMRFKNTGDSLILSSPYYNDRDASDVLITDENVLKPYGLSDLTTRYAMTLHKDKLILQSETLRLFFQRY